MSPSHEQPTARRRWFQFRLRTLLILITAISIWLGWFAHRARTQQAAVAELRAAGAHVTYEWEYVDFDIEFGEQWLIWLDQEPPWPDWLTDRLRDDVFYNVAVVSFSSRAEHGGGGLWRFPYRRRGAPTVARATATASAPPTNHPANRKGDG